MVNIGELPGVDLPHLHSTNSTFFHLNETLWENTNWYIETLLEDINSIGNLFKESQSWPGNK